MAGLMASDSTDNGFSDMPTTRLDYNYIVRQRSMPEQSAISAGLRAGLLDKTDRQCMHLCVKSTQVRQ